jgi:RNA polymerase sigma factor (sigma-70 family)
MPDSSNSSVSQWLRDLKAGDADAAAVLWSRYAPKLLELARSKLKGVSTGAADEEDIAQSVFRNLCKGAAVGRFADIQSRDELWWLLLRVTKNKVVDHFRRETAAKRGGGAVVSETDLTPTAYPAAPFSLDALISDEPTPEHLAMLEEQTQRLLGLLRDDRLRQIACLRIEGYTVSEIATKMTIGTRSVERKLELIRKAWTADLDEQAEA